MSREMKGKVTIIVALMLSMFGASLAGTSLALAQSAPAVAKTAPASMAYIDVTKVPIVEVAVSQPTSAPSIAKAKTDSAPAVDLNDPASIVRGVVWAWQHKAWPYLVLLLLGGLLFLERHYKGALGAKSSAWLGSRKGILITSLIAGIISGCMTAALSGWKGLGWAALAALGTGLINAAAQYGSGPPADKPKPA